jgi:hypothetical protein
MTESGKRRRTMVTQRNTNLACLHSETNKKPHHKSSFLLDTSLSTSPIPANSTRHSVTSRIDRNSRFLCYLIFSTRHLNATLVKRNFVEKFNTCLRFFAASHSFANCTISQRNERSQDRTLTRDGMRRIEELSFGHTPTHRYAIAGKSSRISPSLPVREFVKPGESLTTT